MTLERRGKTVFFVAAMAIVCAVIFITGCEESMPAGGEVPADAGERPC